MLVVSAKSGIKSFSDFRDPQRKVKMASSGKGSASQKETEFLAKAFGLNVEVISGFEGTEGELSMMRGEIDATLGSASALKSFVDNGNGRVVLEIGGEPGSPLPQARDLAGNATSKAIVALIETQSQLSRLTAGPPAIPPETLQVLRDAYIAALTDPALLAEAKKLNLPIASAGGDEVAARVRAALDQTPEMLALLKELLRDE